MQCSSAKRVRLFRTATAHVLRFVGRNLLARRAHLSTGVGDGAHLRSNSRDSCDGDQAQLQAQETVAAHDDRGAQAKRLLLLKKRDDAAAQESAQ